jgi:anaerobic selenocysteine-containing dehydrogenase
MGERRLHTCMLCEAMCGLELELEGDRVTSVRGDREDPLSRGHICPKAVAIEDVRQDPDRVVEPLERTPEGHRAIGWEAALARVAEQVCTLQAKYGPHAVAVYAGNPTVHSFGALLGMVGLQGALQGRSNFSATSVDQLPHMLAAYQMFGNQLLLPVPDVDRTQLFLMIGANPLASNGSLMTAPGIADRLQALRARGGRLVVVDPRRTETAAIADTHLAIQPGTDALFLLALLHVIVREGRAAPAHLAAFTDGLEQLPRLLEPFTPEAVAAKTRLDAVAIRTLARDFAASGRAVAYGRLGICTQATGGTSAWLVYLLNVVTGNLDRAGGAMFPTPAVDLAALAAKLGKQGSFGRFKTRVRGLPEFTGEQPVSALAEEIETPGERQIRALITFAGNPVLSTPNGTRLDRALAKLDFMVSFDLYKNATTRHAHLILPTSFGFERDHYDLAFNALSVRNTARFAPAAVPRRGSTREDFELLLSVGAAIAERRGDGKARLTSVALSGLRKLGSRRVLDLLLRLGPHHLSLDALRRAPHGLDLGALEPRLPGVLSTPKRRIDAVPALFAADLPRLAAMLLEAPSARPHDLVLIGRRNLRSNNSWMHNSARLTKGKPACTLLMHPSDAAARGVADGDAVAVRSLRGEVHTTVELSEAMKPGVVSLPHGHGHGRDGVVLRVARERPGVSLNDLTDEQAVDPVSGNAVLTGVGVDVRALPA